MEGLEAAKSANPKGLGENVNFEKGESEKVVSENGCVKSTLNVKVDRIVVKGMWELKRRKGKLKRFVREGRLGLRRC